MNAYKLLTVIVVSVLVAILLASALNSFTRVSDSALAQVFAPVLNGGAQGGSNAPRTAPGKNYLPIIFLNSPGAVDSWLLIGNAGTDPNNNFIGTLDVVTFTFRVSNTVAYRIAPAVDPVYGFAPNIIGGYGGNTIAPGVFGATIAGGGVPGWENVITASYGFIGGGDKNTAAGTEATVGGGGLNTAGGTDSFVGGGYSNRASGYEATVGGGGVNIASGTSSFVGGGGYGPIANSGNQAQGYASSVVGGISNTVTAGGMYGFVGGGYANTTNGLFAFVGGGNANTANGLGAFVGGGGYNGVLFARNRADGAASTIGGGISNTISSTGIHAVIGGGINNSASGASAFIGGGGYNTASGFLATIPGGFENSATMSYTFAAGCNAQANHQGAFVWADSTGVCSSFASTGKNQFLVRAQGGVGINTNNPTDPVDLLTANGNYGFVQTDGTVKVGTWIGVGLGGASEGGWYGTQTNHPLYFFTNNGSARMTITPTNGYVGIGTTNPQDRLEVNGVLRLDVISNTGVTNLCWNAVGEIAICSSSLRYKNNVADLTLGLDAIAKLRPVTFNWKETNQPDLGFVAEEVNQITPLLTTLNKDGQIEGVKYDRITAVLVKGMQEQQAQIAELQTTNATQQDEIAQLKNQNANLAARVSAIEQEMGTANGAPANPLQGKEASPGSIIEGGGASALPISRDALFIGALVVCGFIVIGRRRHV